MNPRQYRLLLLENVVQKCPGIDPIYLSSAQAENSFGCGYFRTTDNHQENQMVRMILPVADGGFGRGYEDNPGFCDQLRCLDWADLAWCRKMVCESFSRRLSRVFSFRYCREAA